MATRFEAALHGSDPVALRAAGEEALEEVARWEAQLSLYRSTSEIARINALAHREPVRVSPPVFRLLERARQLQNETDGAFDITVAPLVRCWGFMRGTGAVPEPEELMEVRSRVGMALVHLDGTQFSVRFEREGVMVDLGAIGKGFALERAAELLRELGVQSALLHGGTSTVCAIGHPPGQEAWKVALELPRAASPPRSNPGKAELSSGDFVTNASQPLAIVPLRDESLSVSAVWGKAFEVGGRTYGHVIDPRSGQPTEAAVLAAVVLRSATDADALSTALLTMGRSGQARIAALRPGIRTFVVEPPHGQPRARGEGIAAPAAAVSSGQKPR